MENQDSYIIDTVINIVNELKATFASTLNEVKNISMATDQHQQAQVEKCVADMNEHVKRVEANVQEYCNEVSAQVRATELANQTRADNIIKSNRLLTLATLYASKGMSEHEAIAILKSLEAKL